LAGVVLGIAAAFGLTRLLSTFLFGVRPVDLIVFVTVPILIGVAALGAIWFPARRAAATDPAEALR
jgi:putative ABC transport system permease protein